LRSHAIKNKRDRLNNQLRLVVSGCDDRCAWSRCASHSVSGETILHASLATRRDPQHLTNSALRKKSVYQSAKRTNDGSPAVHCWEKELKDV